MAPTQLQAAEWYGMDPAELAKFKDAATQFQWRYVKAGGVTMAATCKGTGAPTVVYSGALNAPAAWSWSLIALEQSKDHRVCMFDRPEVGFSSIRPPEAKKNGPVAASEEMLALLAAMGEVGPFALVGWSYGGLVAQVAAETNSEDVAGLVLVEALPPTFWRGWDDPAYEGNSKLDMASGEKVMGKSLNVGSDPLVVLEAGKVAKGTPAKDARDWTAAQKRLAEGSSNSVYAVVDDAYHEIPNQNPAAVLAATAAVLESLDSGQDMPDCPGALAKAGSSC